MRLKDSTYETIKRRVVDFLEDYGVDSYPLDVLALAAKTGIALVAYSTLPPAKRSAALEYSEDAFRVISPDYSRVSIYYNDERPTVRTRYNVAHELAHIILEHGSRDDEEEVESEADFFAAYLLMPVPLVLNLCGPDPSEVSEFFETSYESATFAVRRAKARVRCGEPPKEYELRLISNILDTMRGCDPIE